MARTSFLSLLALLGAGCSAWIDTDPGNLGPLTPGQGASCQSGCDDGIACTADSCVNNSCQHLAINDMCTANQSCDVTRGCVATGISCDPNQADCWPCDNAKVDADGDGHFARIGDSACGDDCADTDGKTYPGAIEECDGKDNDCNGSVDEGCNATPPSCQAARVVTLASGKAQLSGPLGTSSARFDTDCGAGLGRGAVYIVDVQQLADIVIDSTGSDSPTIVAAGNLCNTRGGFNIGCAGPLSTTQNGSRLVIHRYDPAIQGRSLFVLVDSPVNRLGGTFKLDISVVPAVQYTCLGAPLDISKGGTLVGYMGPTGSLNGSCMPFSSPLQADAVVRYTATAATNLFCEAKSVAFAPALYAQSICGFPIGEIDCEQAAGPGVNAAIELKLAAQETSTIVIDNGRDGARYELTCKER